MHLYGVWLLESFCICYVCIIAGAFTKESRAGIYHHMWRYDVEISATAGKIICFMGAKITLPGLSIFRAFRGKHITLVVRFPNQGRQVEDLDIWSHTNDTIGQVRRCILNRIKANSAHTKVELFIGGELVDPADDRKLIGQLNLKDKTVSVAG